MKRNIYRSIAVFMILFFMMGLSQISLGQTTIEESSDTPMLQAGCKKVWSGIIARLRIYDQPTSTGNKVFVYTGSGSNSEYVGWSADANMIKALFNSLDKGAMTGYTNSRCKIEWMDFR